MRCPQTRLNRTTRVKRLVVALTALGLTQVARADQVVADGTSYADAKVVGFEQGRLAFRAADGQLRNVFVDQVDLILMDRGGLFADFNQAERYLHMGDRENAVVRYRRTLRLAGEFWPELIDARLLKACDHPSMLDQAAASFLRAARGRYSGPTAAARLIPRGFPQQRDGKVVGALDQLDAAISKETDETTSLPTRFFRYEILRRTGDLRATSESRSIALSAIPQAVRCERIFEIQFAALAEVLKDGGSAEELGGLDSAIRDCPESALPSFLLLKGRTLLAAASTRDELIRASWPLMRVVVHMPDDSRAAEGLYAAAEALERLGNNDKAIELLRECVAHKQVPDETRQRAETSLARLQSPTGPS